VVPFQLLFAISFFKGSVWVFKTCTALLFFGGKILVQKSALENG